jgi:hypothetical protein
MGLLSVFITGWLVLIAAVILNLAADRLGITGWYGFLTGLSAEGRLFLSRISWKDIAWLFFVYPLSLGLAARAGFMFSQLILQK